jgi:hypothetical protein
MNVFSLKYRTKYDDPLNAVTKTSTKVIIDKVKLAHEIVQNSVHWDVLDLCKRTQELVNFIRRSNHLEKMFD